MSMDESPDKAEVGQRGMSQGWGRQKICIRIALDSRITSSRSSQRLYAEPLLLSYFRARVKERVLRGKMSMSKLTISLKKFIMKNKNKNKNNTFGFNYRRERNSLICCDNG
jgi:hypothetical protein